MAKTTNSQNTKLNSFGLVSLLLGIIATTWGVVKYFHWSAFVFAPAAIIFGIIALNSKKTGNIGRKGFSLFGIILGIIGLIAAIVWTIVIATSSNDSNEEYQSSSQDRRERSSSNSSSSDRDSNRNRGKNNNPTKRN